MQLKIRIDKQMNCPLCSTDVNEDFALTTSRTYYLCKKCGLIFTSENFFLSNDEERSRYCFHQNNIEDDGYVKFLEQVIEPLLKKLPPEATGLDYGCGPGPVLSELLKRKGFFCDIYDPYFFPTIDLNVQYDFITATECFEHFHNPAAELDRISKMLKPGGLLAIMTEFYTPNKIFTDWYYIKDPTHVCFYSDQTIDFIAKKLTLMLIYNDGKRVVIMKKL